MCVGGETGGVVLAVLTTFIIVALAFALALWPIVKTGKLPTIVSIGASAAVVAAVSRFNPRPELFTTLFVTLTCFVLTRDRASRTLLALPLLFILWTNLHGGVLFGLAVLWATAICDLIPFQADMASRRLLTITIGCSVAILLNPYGVHYLSVFAPLESHSFSYINEWRPIWEPPDINPQIIVCDFVIAIGAIAAWALNKDRRLAHGVWVLAGVASFIGARRNMDLCALIALFVFVWNFQAASDSKWNAAPSSQKLIPILRIGAAIFATGWLSVLILGTLFGQMLSGFRLTTVSDFPDEQAAFIRTANLGGPVLNSYETSAYYEWRLGGDPPLFIDELNAYPKSVYDQYLDIWSATPNGINSLNALGIKTVIGQRYESNQQVPALYNYLFTSPEWAVVYKGKGGVVFVRR